MFDEGFLERQLSRLGNGIRSVPKLGRIFDYSFEHIPIVAGRISDLINITGGGMIAYGAAKENYSLAVAGGIITAVGVICSFTRDRYLDHFIIKDITGENNQGARQENTPL